MKSLITTITTITTLLCLFFSVFLVASAHAETIYEHDYETYKSTLYTDVTDIINSDFVVRVDGNFNYFYYPVSKKVGNDNKETFNYMGAGGNIALYYCKENSCYGVDQTLATIYTYKNSGNHFLGATYIGYLHRNLFSSRLLLQYGAGVGVAYASNSNDVEKKVFFGKGLAISLKFNIILTIFFNRDIGAGLNIAPSVLYNLGDNTYESSIFYGVDAGIHLMFKY